MIGRICVFAAICAAAALAAFIQPEQADASSAVVATATHHCSQVSAASRHRSEGFRVLSSAQADKAQHLCSEAQARIGTLRFWNKPARSWTLYRQHRRDTCWDLQRKRLLQGPELLCVTARGAVRTSTQKLAHLDAKLRALLPKSPVVHNWLYRTFLCIHAGEGSWDDDTGNGYYGGLQMDLSFQRSYGGDFMARWGTADHWPAWAQIAAAERAYRSGRGFSPWPNTARACGLL